MSVDNTFLNDDNLQVIWKNIHDRFVRKNQLDGYESLDLSKIGAKCNFNGKFIDCEDDFIFLNRYVYLSKDSLNNIVPFLKSPAYKNIKFSQQTEPEYLILCDYYNDKYNDKYSDISSYAMCIYESILVSVSGEKLYKLKITHVDTDLGYPIRLYLSSYLEPNSAISESVIISMCNILLN